MPTQHSLKNLSIISVILLVFVLPLVTLYHPEDVWCFTSRMYYGIKVFVIHLALAMWLFRLGLSIGKSKSIRICRGTKILLIFLCVIVYVSKNCLMYPMNQWDIYNNMSSHIGWYISEMLAYRLPIILHGLIFFVIGLFESDKDIKLFVSDKDININLSGSRLKQLGLMLSLLFLIGCCASEWLYFRDRFYAMIVSALAVFPLIGTIMVTYRLAAENTFDNYIEKHYKLYDFLVYLYPSVIFIYLLEIYFPTQVVIYLGVMWLIYRWAHKKI